MLDATYCEQHTDMFVIKLNAYMFFGGKAEIASSGAFYHDDGLCFTALSFNLCLVVKSTCILNSLC